MSPGTASHVLLALLVGAGLGLGGCSDEPPSPSPSSAGSASAGSSAPPGSEASSPEPTPEGLSLTFIQTRSLEGTGRAQIRVTNGTGTDYDVTRVGLDWPGFPSEPQPFPYLVPAGLTYDLPFDLPEPDCAEENATTPAYAVATTADAAYRLPLDESGLRFLDRLWRTACDEQAVARVVSEFSYGERWVRRGVGRRAVLAGEVTLRRGPDPEPVTLTRAKGSVLFGLGLPGATRLETGASSATLPLVVRPGRCDEHARSQSTQTFVWRFWVRVGERAPVSHIVRPDEPDQEGLLAFLDWACATD